MKCLLFIGLILISHNFFVDCGEKVKNIEVDEPQIDPKFADDLQKALSSLSEKQIPDYFKTPKDDDSHWCCKTDTPIISLDQTRIVSFQITNGENQRCGYSSCGFWGWSSCTRWCAVYWLETRYHEETYTITQQTPCPQNQITCCANYFLIMDHCFHITEVQNNLDLLAALNNQGIVLPGVGK